MTSRWYITQDDQRLGPLSLDALHKLIDAGRVAPTAQFSRDGETPIDVETLRRTWPAPPPLPSGAELLPMQPSAQLGEDDPAAEFAKPTPSGSDLRRTTPVVERDAILILGRRRSGKTIYLATLYAMLWKSVRGLTMKALSGPAHEMLMSIVDQLKRGVWPEATLGTRQVEFELNDHGRTRLLLAFDYSGEDFRQAFVEEDTASPQVRKLLSYVDRAAAVILLLDPAVAVSGKHEEVVDDDFGMVQAVERIRNWQGGTNVPVAIALTKADRNRNLIQSHGSGPEFVLRHYPALSRTLQRVAIYPVSAVQETVAADGSVVPNPDSLPINVDLPLLHCLERLARRERRHQRRAEREAAEAARLEMQRRELEAFVRSNRRLTVIMVGVLILTFCGLALLYMLMTR